MVLAEELFKPSSNPQLIVVNEALCKALIESLKGTLKGVLKMTTTWKVFTTWGVAIDTTPETTSRVCELGQYVGKNQVIV